MDRSLAFARGPTAPCEGSPRFQEALAVSCHSSIDRAVETLVAGSRDGDPDGRELVSGILDLVEEDLEVGRQEPSRPTLPYDPIPARPGIAAMPATPADGESGLGLSRGGISRPAFRHRKRSAGRPKHGVGCNHQNEKNREDDGRNEPSFPVFHGAPRTLAGAHVSLCHRCPESFCNGATSLTPSSAGRPMPNRGNAASMIECSRCRELYGSICRLVGEVTIRSYLDAATHSPRAIPRGRRHAPRCSKAAGVCR